MDIKKLSRVADSTTSVDYKSKLRRVKDDAASTPAKKLLRMLLSGDSEKIKDADEEYPGQKKWHKKLEKQIAEEQKTQGGQG